LALKFFEGEGGDVFAKDFALQARDQLLFDPVTPNHEGIGADSAILMERTSVLRPSRATTARDQDDV